MNFMNENNYNGFDQFTMWALSPIIGKKNLAKLKNAEEFRDNISRLVNLALNTFEWEGLPKTINEKLLEKILLTNGRIAVGDDKEYGFLALPYSESSLLNIYGEPTKITLHGFTKGYSKEFTPYITTSNNDIANAVRCFDNPTNYPYINYILRAATRIAETQRTIDVNVQKLKNPFVFVGAKDSEADYKQFMQDIKNNEEAIIITNTNAVQIGNKTIDLLPTSIDVSVVTALREHKNAQFSEIKELLGIENNENIDKKERLLTDEVKANNQSTLLSIDLRLKERQRFCEQLNECFGLDVSVKVRKEIVEEYYNIIEEEDVEYESEERNEENKGNE